MTSLGRLKQTRCFVTLKLLSFLRVEVIKLGRRLGTVGKLGKKKREKGKRSVGHTHPKYCTYRSSSLSLVVLLSSLREG